MNNQSQNTNINTNPLYPIFLKLHQLNMLIVGAGYVGYEKLHFILKSSPNAQITVVAPDVADNVWALIKKYPQIKVIQRTFQPQDVEGKDLVIAATDLKELNKEVRFWAKKYGALVNVADTPDLCDFYLGAIVTRGHLKVAISTNGQSPTFAKRFRQVLEEILPQNVTNLLSNLHVIRQRLKGDFAHKVEQLNSITASLLD